MTTKLVSLIVLSTLQISSEANLIPTAKFPIRGTYIGKAAQISLASRHAATQKFPLWRQCRKKFDKLIACINKVDMNAKKTNGAKNDNPLNGDNKLNVANKIIEIGANK